MNILINGSGIAVYFLCKRFVSKGYRLTIVSSVPQDCDYYARYLKALIIEGEGSDPDILTQANIHDQDLFIAMDGKDQNNLVACQYAKLYFKVPRILAVINDPDNEEVFAQLGIKAVSGIKFLVDIIDNLAVLDEIRQQIPLVEGKILVSEIEVSAQAKCVSKALKDIVIPYQALIACVLRMNEVIIPRGNTVIMANDRLLLITTPDTHSFVVSILI